MKPLFEHAVIAGVGLIGGSLAIAGKKAGVFGSVTGLGRGRSNLDKAMELGLVDAITTNLAEACRGADLFFAAIPVESIPGLCVEAAGYLPENCLLTDGGSVKREIVSQLEKKLPRNLRFVGGHPVSGTEKSGATAAVDTLFNNRYTILTPTQSTDPDAVDLVGAMWRAVGANVVTMSPEKHDHAMAIISHLPHFAAYALVEAIVNADDSDSIKRFVAGGFKDTTRIAASDPAMWRDIFSMNQDSLLTAVELFEKSLSSFKNDIINRDFDTLEKKLEKIRDERLRLDDQHA